MKLVQFWKDKTPALGLQTPQGIIDVQGGGTFSMNYNDFGGGEFLTGASINGQLRLADGAILENAAIYSHINYLADSRLPWRRALSALLTPPWPRWSPRPGVSCASA